jgi:hypothetical protein
MATFHAHCWWIEIEPPRSGFETPDHMDIPVDLQLLFGIADLE